MRSSDQRYRHVQRVKRDTLSTEQWNKQLVLALRESRLTGEFSGVEEAVKGGASEFSHIALVCGRTANDFAKNYRRGSPTWHCLPLNNLCAIEALRGEKLDGFTFLRLSREQTKNVKQRWMKLRNCDRLLHDPHGVHWIKLMRAWLAGEDDGHLGLFCDLRDRGEDLVAQKAIEGTPEAVERASREFVRFVETLGDQQPDWMKPWDAAQCEKEARAAYFRAKRMMRDGAAFAGQSEAETRLDIEKQLVVVEAFMNGGNVMSAYHDPDTSGRHSRLSPRMDRIDRTVGLKWRKSA